MGDEIIKLIEYIVGHPIVQGALIAYVVYGVIVVALAVTVFVMTFRAILRRNHIK